MFDPSTLLIAGGGAALWSFWGQIKEFFVKIYTYFVVVVEFESYPLGKAVGSYVFNKFSKSPFGVKQYAGKYFFVKPENKELVVAFEELSKASSLFWRGWVPIWIKCSYDDKEGKDNCQVSFIRGTMKVDEFFQKCIDHYNGLKFENDSRVAVHYIVGTSSKNKGAGPDRVNARRNRNDNPSEDIPKSVRYLKYSIDDLGPKEVSKVNVPLSNEYKTTLDDIMQWKNSEDWFKSRGIPWRYGMELYGKPGTGKTSFVRFLAEKLNVPVYLFDIASLDNQEFRHGWQEMVHDVPCIALIEDIDSVFHGRDNISKTEDGLTFDCLLNCVEGVEATDGLIFIITTNKPELVDEALASVDQSGKCSRPGRINKVIEFKDPGKEVFLRLARKILSDYDCALWEQQAELGFKEKDTIAQFHYRCTSLATKLYWEKRANEKNSPRK